MENKPTIFRKKTLDSISQPDQLTDYLRVTRPVVWLILAAVISILLGLVIWCFAGTVEITAEGDAVVSNGEIMIMLTDNEKYQLQKGMKVMIDDEEITITETEKNIFGNSVGYGQTSELDGVYSASVVVKKVHPLELLFGV